MAGLAIGGAGFGAGYAVGDNGDTTQQTTPFTPGERGFPGGQMGTPPGTSDGGTGDSTGQAPDFDGDGQPDETAPTPAPTRVRLDHPAGLTDRLAPAPLAPEVRRGEPFPTTLTAVTSADARPRTGA